MEGQLRVPKGLAGVAVTDTAIAKSDADGSLLYRGYPIEELAANAGFEETAYLVLNGKLPKPAELKAFSSDLAKRSHVEAKVFEIMGDLGPDAHPIDVLRTATSALGSIDRENDARGKELSIEAKMSTLVANCRHVPRGEAALEPTGAEGFAGSLLSMLTDREATDYEKWVFERTLIFYMEHDLNASSFTVRVVASTLADPYAAAAAGLAALKGPLHGGANEGAMQMLLQLKNPEAAVSYVNQALKEKKKVIGFGHRVYKDFDPRARLCKEYLREMIKKRNWDDKLYRTCDALEKEMWEKKRLPPNLDYYAAPIFYLLGIDIPLYTPIFAASRVFGWMAHYNEQVEENKLIRPDATYVGPVGLKYAPPERR